MHNYNRKNDNVDERKKMEGEYLSATWLSGGVQGIVRGLEGIHLADRCILTRFE
jgi:hypothetical protein